MIGSPELCRTAGISYRQLDYWCRIGLVLGQGERVGSGDRRAFTAEQVRAVDFLAAVAPVIGRNPLETALQVVRAVQACTVPGHVIVYDLTDGSYRVCASRSHAGALVAELIAASADTQRLVVWECAR